MQPDDNGENFMEQHSFSGGNNQRWELIYDTSAGYYKVKNINSGLYLTSPDTTETGDNVVQQTYSTSIENRQFWVFTKLADGSYKIQTKACIGTNLVLSVGFSFDEGTAGTDGINIRQEIFNDDNDKGEWRICSINETNNAILLAINDVDGEDRDNYFSKTIANLGCIRNNFLTISDELVYTNSSIDEMKNFLSNYSIFIVHTHGASNRFKIGKDSYITMENLNSINLSGLDFALLLTCSTGFGFSEDHITANQPTNIVEKMVCCGARTVVGFNDTTMVWDCNLFAPDLTEKMIIDGLGVEDAIDSISYYYYLKNMSSLAEIGGDTENSLNNK